MPDKNTDFTYVSILKELGKEVATAAKKKTHYTGATLTRANLWFKGITGGLILHSINDIAAGKKTISRKLSIKKEKIKEAEEVLLLNLSSWTQKNTRYEVGRPPAWPPLIPISLTIQRFVAITIGRQSESPEKPFVDYIQTSFADTVAPALAWGLWCQFNELAKESPPSLAQAIENAIMNQYDGESDVAKLGLPDDKHTSIEIPYLRLLHGWLNLLKQPQANWKLDSNSVRNARLEILNQFRSYLKNPDSGLSGLLLQHYGPNDQGAERALAVAMVHKRSANSAAFLRSRLCLLSGAQLPELREFRNLINSNLKKALENTEGFLKEDRLKVENYGELACGRAYWLARVAFGKHSFPGLNEQKASELTLKLLERAAECFESNDERRTYCLRFAAGYATNPRYLRAEYVLEKQNEIVEKYANAHLSRHSLKAMFLARIAWQKYKYNPIKQTLKKAAELYSKALEGAFDSTNGLDSEAPIHLFPELYVFLDDFDDNSAGSRKVLGIIDYVVQHNFGIYFDAPTEKRLIQAGIEEFCNWQKENPEAISQEAALRGLAESKAQNDPKAGEIFERVVRKNNAKNTPEEEAPEET